MKYKVGDKVRIKSLDWYNENKNEYDNVDCGERCFTHDMISYCGKILTISYIIESEGCYEMMNSDYCWTDDMIEGLAEENMGEVSDGYHTFNELYEYRLLYNASFFNELAKQNLYDVHKSKKHSDGEDCFGGGQFIVMAELPTGQISNHYELKDWDLFQVPEKELANKWDGHTPQDVAKRMREFLTPKPKYPKTYEECCENTFGLIHCGMTVDVPMHYSPLIINFTKLLICRYAYWKIAGEEMGLGKPWEPDWTKDTEKYVIYPYQYLYSIDIENYRNTLLAFPNREMRDAFYENFKDLIEQCKELL